MPPLDAQAQQILNQRNGVQAAPQAAPQQAPAGQRSPPIIYGAPRQAPPPNPVSVATENRQTEQNTWRTMTDEEIQAAGLSGTSYQVNGLNEIKPIGGAPAAGNSGGVPTDVRISRLQTLLEQADRVEELHGSNVAGGLPNPIAGRVPGVPAYEQFNSAGAGLSEQGLSAFRVPGVGAQSDAELRAFVDANRPLASDTDAAIQEKLRNIRARAQAELEALGVTAPTGRENPGAPVATQPLGAIAREGGLPPAGSGNSNGGGSGGDVSPLQAAFDSGASREVIMSMAERMGLSVNEADLDANLRLREQGQATGGFTAPETATAPPQPTRDGLSAILFGDGTRSIGEQLGAGVGDIVQGVGDVIGIGANPLGRAMGLGDSYDAGQTMRDASGLPDNPNQLQSAINRGATSALTFGGAARGAATLAANPTAQGVLTTLGRTPARDAVAGASAGAGAYAARDMGPLAQTGAALAAGGLGYGAAGMVPGVRAAASAAPASAAAGGARQVVEAGQREGVRVMTSDVVPPRTAVGNAARNTGERIPYAGTGGPRVAQQAERQRAVENVAREFGAVGTDDHIAAVSADMSRTRGQALTSLTTRKDNIIDGTSGAVAAPRAVAAIDEQIARLEGTNAQTFAPVIRQLQTFREVLTSGKTLRQVEENRRLLGDMFSDESLANIRGLGEKAVRAVYTPLREDMVEFVRGEAGEAAASQLEKVNERLAAMVGDLDSTTFRRALSQADTTPETAARLLFSANESDVRRLVENLSPVGRSHAQSAIIYRAIESAGDLNAVAGLSPQKFATAIGRYSNNIGVVFEPNDAARLQGLQRLLQATQRASEAAANPPTGVQNNVPILAAVLTDMMGGAGSALSTGAMGGLMARLYESAAVRNRLIGLSRSKPGSEQEARTIENIARIMASQPSLREAFTGAANDNLALPANVAAGPEDRKR